MKLKTFLTLAASLASSIALASGNEGSGGGSFVLLGNNKVVADSFVRAAGTTREMTLSAEGHLYFAELKALLELYGISSDEFWITAHGRAAEYFYTSKLPCTDEMEVDASAGRTYQYGCTVNGITYLDELEFPSPEHPEIKVDFKNQMLALIHERLHAFRPDINKHTHHRIAGFVSALDTLITVYTRQQTGDLSPLTTVELNSIEDLYRRAMQLGFKINSICKIIPNGGGCLASPLARVDGRSVVGIGSKIEKGSVVLNSEITGMSTLSAISVEDSKLFNSRLTGLNSCLESEHTCAVTIKKSEIANASYIASSYGAHSGPLTIASSIIKNCSVNPMNASTFQNSTCVNSNLMGPMILLNSKLVDSSFFSSSSGWATPLTLKEVAVHNLDISLTNNAGLAGANTITIDGKGSSLDFARYGKWQGISKKNGPKTFKDEESFYQACDGRPRQ